MKLMKQRVAAFFIFIAAVVFIPACGFLNSNDDSASSHLTADSSGIKSEGNQGSKGFHDIVGNETLSAKEYQAGRLNGGYHTLFVQNYSESNPALNSVVKLSRIQGKNIRDILGSGVFDADAIAEAARTVLLAHSDSIGVGSGRLQFDTVRISDHLASVHWKQTAELKDGSEVEVVGAGVTVHINSAGNITQILNRTYNGLEGLASPTWDKVALSSEVLRSLTVVTMDVERNGKTSSELVPFTATDTELSGPFIYVTEKGLPTLSYLVLTHGKIKLAQGDKKASYAVYINAHSGHLEAVLPTAVHAFTAKGIVEVYHNKPLYPAVLTAPAYELDDTLFELEGRYANVHDEVIGDPIEPNREFKYITSNPSDYKALAEAYKASYDLITYMKRLGFESLFAGPSVYTDALDVDFPTSGYHTMLRQIFLSAGGLFPDADDATVTQHEFGHYFHHLIGGSGINGYPFNPPDAIDEGTADYHTTSFFNNPLFAEIFAIQTGDPYTRSLDQDLNIVDNPSGNQHEYGQIWSSALWKLRKVLGKGTVDRLAMQFIYHILPDDTMDIAMETALLQADQDLYGGIHEGIIRKTFAFAKIYGTAGSYNFTTDFIQSPSRPYADNESSEQVLRLKNATLFGGIRLTFGDQSNVTVNDSLEIRNDKGQVIHTLTRGNINGRTFLIPNSDEARVRVNSPADKLSGNGYNVVAAAYKNLVGFPEPEFNVTAVPRGGNDPLPVTFTVTGRNLRSVRINTGDGSEDFFPELNANGEWVYEHMYNYDYNLGQITALRRFTATITVSDDKGQQATTTRNIRVLPFSLRKTPLAYNGSLSVTQCTLTPIGLSCL